MSYFNAPLMAMAFTTTLTSMAIYADEYCHVDLSAGFAITVNTTEFLSESQDENTSKNILYKITQGKNLFVGNELIELNEYQKSLVMQYDAKIRQLVPQVKKVAVDGIDSAIEGVNLAFDGLLGEGNTVGADLTKEFTVIRTQVIDNLAIEQGITLGVEGLESETLLGKDFDQKIESAVKKSLLSSMGSIVMVMAQQMLLAGGKGLSFEDRMANFGETIDQEITLRTAKINEQIEVLCLSIAEVDILEEQLKAEIRQLAKINVFTVQNSRDSVNKSASLI